MVLPPTTEPPNKMEWLLPKSSEDFDESGIGMGTGFAIGAKERVIIPLQDFRSQNRINGKIGQIGQLGSLFDQPFSFAAEKKSIGKGSIHKVPGMGMKGIEPAKPALKFSALYLQPRRKGSGHEVGLFHFDPVLGDGKRGIEIEIRVYGGKEAKVLLPSG